jgi:hypothetical protein
VDAAWALITSKQITFLPPLRGKVAAELQSSEGGRKGGELIESYPTRSIRACAAAGARNFAPLIT